MDRKHLVLVADDEPAVRQITRRVLERNCCHVVEAASGDEALALLRAEHPFDLLVTDVRMPGLTGDEVVRQIRADGVTLKVVYVTGLLESQSDASSAPSETDAWIVKVPPDSVTRSGRTRPGNCVPPPLPTRTPRKH